MRTRNTLFGKDKVRLKLDDLLGHLLDLLLFNLEQAVPVGLFGHFDVCLGLALLVFQGAVEQEDAGVLDAPAHLGVGDVLVEHDTVEHLGLLNLSTRHLFHTGVALHVDFLAAVVVFADNADGLQGKRTHEVGPARNKLGADGGLDEAEHFRLVVDVDGHADLVNDLESLAESLFVGSDHNDGVNVALEKGKGMCEDFTSCREYAEEGYEPPLQNADVDNKNNSAYQE